MIPVIAIGTSAGGQKALTELLQQLQPDFPAAVLITSHLWPHQPSYLPEILARATSLPIARAQNGETVRKGRVYMAVPDRHLMLAGNRIRLTRGPRENHARPSIDVLFRSCASSLGSKAIGTVLTGELDDGTAGLWTIKDTRGQAIVQSPEDAEFPSMPRSALEHVVADYVTSLADMPAVFLQAIRVSELRSGGEIVSDRLKIETQIAEGRDALTTGSLQLGPCTELTCPDCGGVLSQIEEGSIVRFRCHTGHAYSEQALLTGTDEKRDDLLWRVLRAVDERTLILERRLSLSKVSGSPQSIQQLRRQIETNHKSGDIIRALLLDEAASDQVSP